MSKTRIYLISGAASVHLVRASSRAQAIGHVARSTYQSRVATQADLVDALGGGVKVEDASAEVDAD